MEAERIRYALDTEGMSTAEQLKVTAEMLALLSPRLHAVEMEIQLDRHAEWPARAQAAAHRVGDALSAGEGRGRTQLVRRSRPTPEELSDLVLLAPYAYHASCRDVDGRELADLNDENSSNTWLLSAVEHAHLCRIAGAHRVVELGEWRRRRREGSALGRLRNRLI